ncbi:phosphoribosylaminoimidazolesuccinocarboxamide synthase [Candidatus Peregrinibacteria bacterium]|nr:phosphoribosylaminoimidazolesuccinocarboxamide synthase [Candidatus Peregrinibacteria bacterium]
MLSKEMIEKQVSHCLKETHFEHLGKKYEGKVRDNYSFDAKRILITTDRLSAFDRIITTIPFKGQVLNQITRFWFEKTSDIVKNHAISFPDSNVVLAHECEPLPIEMVVRGYLTGVTTTSAWYNYERGVRNFCGNILPEGMKKNQRFSEPILTPSTKAEKGGHDESVSAEEIVSRKLISIDNMRKLCDIALKLYKRGVEICAKQGIILVDTKYEFGFLNGEIVLIDEIHTPDSSRFWFKDSYDELFKKGEEQKKIDKEYVREWLADHGFRGEGEIPLVPDDVRVETARRYIEAYELITGMTFQAEVGDPSARIQKNISMMKNI